MQYIGKDVLTQGSLLHLDPVIAWERLRSRAKQGIRKAQKAGVRMVESRDLSLMARVWYNPDTLTSELTPDQRMYLAYLGEELVGGIIVTPVTSNTLFYHYGGTNELGRSVEANAYMFWHIVEEFKGSRFKYLDVGVSFRPELQHYFQKYCTQPYPILFHPPAEEVRPVIHLGPFAAEHLDWVEQQNVAINTQLLEFFEAEFTFMPAWEFALQSALRALNLPPSATVGVWASAGENSYLTLLARLFGDRFTFIARARDADCYLVCHRWGVLCPDVEALSVEKVPLIEDCRDALSLKEQDSQVGGYGRYAVYDFTRWFPLQFGAALAGEFFPDQHVWDHFHCLDVTKRNIVRELLQIHWPRREEYYGIRAVNWKRYAELFELIGMTPEFPLSGAPSVFVVDTGQEYPPAEVRDRLRRFGVSVEIDDQDGLVAFPCHSGMRRGHVDYVFGALRGMVNPCHTFVRRDPEGTVA